MTDTDDTTPDAPAEEWTDEKYAEIEAQARQSRLYMRYATVETIDHIAERVIDLVTSGRRMTLVEHIGESTTAYKVTAGLVVDTDARQPISHRPRQGFHIALSRDNGHGWHGIGAHVSHMHPTRSQLSAAFERDRAWRLKQAEEIEDEFQRAVAIERVAYLQSGVRDVTYVTVDGGPRFGMSTEDYVTIRHMNDHGVECTSHLAFDTDYLRLPPYQPSRPEWDPSGSEGAEHIVEKAPAATRWGLLRDLLDRHPDAPAAMWDELADLDVTVRPWAHGATE